MPGLGPPFPYKPNSCSTQLSQSCFKVPLRHGPTGRTFVFHALGLGPEAHQSDLQKTSSPGPYLYVRTSRKDHSTHCTSTRPNHHREHCHFALQPASSSIPPIQVVAARGAQYNAGKEDRNRGFRKIKSNHGSQNDLLGRLRYVAPLAHHGK